MDEIIDSIYKLISTHPNDADLGKVLREYITNLK